VGEPLGSAAGTGSTSDRLLGLIRAEGSPASLEDVDFAVTPVPSSMLDPASPSRRVPSSGLAAALSRAGPERTASTGAASQRGVGPLRADRPSAPAAGERRVLQDKTGGSASLSASPSAPDSLSTASRGGGDGLPSGRRAGRKGRAEPTGQAASDDGEAGRAPLGDDETAAEADAASLCASGDNPWFEGLVLAGEGAYPDQRTPPLVQPAVLSEGTDSSARQLQLSTLGGNFAKARRALFGFNVGQAVAAYVNAAIGAGPGIQAAMRAMPRRPRGVDEASQLAAQSDLRRGLRRSAAVRAWRNDGADMHRTPLVRRSRRRASPAAALVAAAESSEAASAAAGTAVSAATPPQLSAAGRGAGAASPQARPAVGRGAPASSAAGSTPTRRQEEPGFGSVEDSEDDLLAAENLGRWGEIAARDGGSPSMPDAAADALGVRAGPPVQPGASRTPLRSGSRSGASRRGGASETTPLFGGRGTSREPATDPRPAAAAATPQSGRTWGSRAGAMAGYGSSGVTPGVASSGVSPASAAAATDSSPWPDASEDRTVWGGVDFTPDPHRSSHMRRLSSSGYAESSSWRPPAGDHVTSPSACSTVSNESSDGGSSTPSLAVTKGRRGSRADLLLAGDDQVFGVLPGEAVRFSAPPLDFGPQPRGQGSSGAPHGGAGVAAPHGEESTPSADLHAAARAQAPAHGHSATCPPAQRRQSQSRVAHFLPLRRSSDAEAAIGADAGAHASVRGEAAALGPVQAAASPPPSASPLLASPRPLTPVRSMGSSARSPMDIASGAGASPPPPPPAFKTPVKPQSSLLAANSPSSSPCAFPDRGTARATPAKPGSVPHPEHGGAAGPRQSPARSIDFSPPADASPEGCAGGHVPTTPRQPLRAAAGSTPRQAVHAAVPGSAPAAARPAGAAGSGAAAGGPVARPALLLQAALLAGINATAQALEPAATAMAKARRRPAARSQPHDRAHALAAADGGADGLGSPAGAAATAGGGPELAAPALSVAKARALSRALGAAATSLAREWAVVLTDAGAFAGVPCPAGRLARRGPAAAAQQPAPIGLPPPLTIRQAARSILVERGWPEPSALMVSRVLCGPGEDAAREATREALLRRDLPAMVREASALLAASGAAAITLGLEAESADSLGGRAPALRAAAAEAPPIVLACIMAALGALALELGTLEMASLLQIVTSELVALYGPIGAPVMLLWQPSPYEISAAVEQDVSQSATRLGALAANVPDGWSRNIADWSACVSTIHQPARCAELSRSVDDKHARRLRAARERSDGPLPPSLPWDVTTLWEGLTWEGAPQPLAADASRAPRAERAEDLRPATMRAGGGAAAASGQGAASSSRAPVLSRQAAERQLWSRMAGAAAAASAAGNSPGPSAASSAASHTQGSTHSWRRESGLFSRARSLRRLCARIVSSAIASQLFQALASRACSCIASSICEERAFPHVRRLFDALCEQHSASLAASLAPMRSQWTLEASEAVPAWLVQASSSASPESGLPSVHPDSRADAQRAALTGVWRTLRLLSRHPAWAVASPARVVEQLSVVGNGLLRAQTAYVQWLLRGGVILPEDAGGVDEDPALQAAINNADAMQVYLANRDAALDRDGVDFEACARRALEELIESAARGPLVLPGRDCMKGIDTTDRQFNSAATLLKLDPLLSASIVPFMWFLLAVAKNQQSVGEGAQVRALLESAVCCVGGSTGL